MNCATANRKRRKIGILWFMVVLLLVVCGLRFEAAAMGDLPKAKPLGPIKVEFVKAFGLPGSSDGDFSFPSDIDIGNNGDLETGLGSLFVADTGNNRIQRLDADGDFIYQFGRFGTEAGNLNSPVGVAVDFNSRLYVSERDNDRVQLFDIRGNYIVRIASGEVKFKELNNPAGLCVDRFGSLFIADSGNDRIVKFDELGDFVDAFGGFGFGLGFFDKPMSVAVDRNNLIYVADTNNNRVQVLDYDGRPIRSFGENGDQPGQFSLPEGIAVDADLIYVVDTGNKRVQIFNHNGDFITSFAGFDRPTGISVSNSGQIFVVDSARNLIKQFSLRSL